MSSPVETTVEVAQISRRAMIPTALKQHTASASATSAYHSSFLDYTTTALMSALAVFAPLKEMMVALLFLVIVDTITGLWAAIVRGNQLTSRKLSRTIAKTFVYLFTICVVHVANRFLLSAGDFALPLDSLIVSFIALTELKSIFENLQKIQKQPLLQFLIDRIAADRSESIEKLSRKPGTPVEAKPKERKSGNSKRQK